LRGNAPGEVKAGERGEGIKEYGVGEDIAYTLRV